MRSTINSRSNRLAMAGRAFIYEIALLGSVLLILNLIGLFTSLRSPELTTADTFFGVGDLTLSEQEVLSLARRREGEPTREYVKRVTYAVNKGMAHAWIPGAYNFHVPVTENWILWLLGPVHPGFQLWEFANHHKALERGVGLCSQHAIVLNGLLYEQGVRSQIVSLGALHVVNRVEVAEGEWVIADPDFGLILPDLPDITSELIRTTYRPLIPELPTGAAPEYPDPLDYYIEAYRSPLRFSETLFEYNPGATTLESWAYMLKWLLPVLFVASALICQPIAETPQARSALPVATASRPDWGN